MGPSPVDEIKSRLDIIEVIGSYIKLAKAGRNYKARCPFHSERTPSFMVSPERQMWHCFGCGLGGDIFAFVKQIEGIEFGDALRQLAGRAGVVLKRQDPTLQTQRKRLYEICELATKFFEKQMESKIGFQAQRYLLKERGLKEETLKQWRLGWAPDGWHNLSDFLEDKGYKAEEILQTGLTVTTEQVAGRELPKCHDRFRSRIMFPLFDILGQVVGFAGRIFGKEDSPPADGVGKYINTPQTVLYDKSRLLYGLNFAKIELRKEDSCIFVEGNLDVIMSHQAGTINTVASSGTALTAEHLKIIKRYTDNLIFAFDMDLAGESATRRSIDLALENDFNIKVIKSIADAGDKIKDPADLIKQDPSSWKNAIKDSVSILDYYFSNTFSKYPSASSGQGKPEDKKEIAKILLPIIKRISNQIEKSHWIGELARRLKVDEKLLYSEMQKVKLEDSRVPASNTKDLRPASERTRTDELEERILALYLYFPEQLKDFEQTPEKIFFNEELAKIVEALKDAARHNPEKEKCLKAVQKKLPPELLDKLDYLSFKAEQFPTEAAEAAQEIEDCLKELKIIKIKEEMARVGHEIQEAQAGKDKPKLTKNLEEFKRLSKNLIDLTGIYQ